MSATLGYTVILRHGAYHQRPDAPSARQPFALTDAGRAQAQAGAETLQEMLRTAEITAPLTVHCSRQLRAWQTATEVVATLRACGITLPDPVETSALAERGLGSAANLTAAEIEAVLRDDPRYDAAPPGWKSDSAYRLPLEGAESLLDAGARVAEHLRQSATPGTVQIHVGHGASFRHAFHHLGVLARDEIARLSMFHARPLLFCHEGRVNWQHLAGEWKIRAPQDVPRD